MNAAAALQRTSRTPTARALKSASTEIFRKSRASRGRSAGYRFGASRDFAYAYEKPRQDRQSLQTDPIGYEPDLNLYAYVRNDPVNRSDPTGLYTCNGGNECSKEINQAVGDLQLAHQSASDETTRSQLGELVAATGDLGDSGVDFVVGETAGNAVATSSVGGDGTITVTMNTRAVEGVARWPNEDRIDFAAVTGHEVRHGIDQRALGNRNAGTVAEATTTEQNAYRDTLSIARNLTNAGVGNSSYARAAETSGSEAWIAGGVTASLRNWCSQPGSNAC